MASVRISDAGVYEITSGNYSAVDAYEPGSVGKVITISAALNDGTVTPETVFTVPWQKVYTKRGDRLHDSHVHGDEAMSVERHPHRVVEHRHDHGLRDARGGSGTSFEQQYHYMRAFGLGQRTALNFPDENPGILEPWQKWEGTEKYTVAYGQGVASSPIQLVSAVNVIANDGMYVAPEARALDGRRRRRGARHAAVGDPRGRAAGGRRADAADDEAGRVRGHGQAGPGAGAVDRRQDRHRLHRPGERRLRATTDGTKAYYASFVGFLPAEDPQVTILVSIDQPPADSGDRFGGTAAAPVFQQLAPTMVHELDIEPPPGSTGCPE